MAIHEQLSNYFTVSSLFCTQQYGFIQDTRYFISDTKPIVKRTQLKTY